MSLTRRHFVQHALAAGTGAVLARHAHAAPEQRQQRRQERAPPAGDEAIEVDTFHASVLHGAREDVSHLPLRPGVR